MRRAVARAVIAAGLLALASVLWPWLAPAWAKVSGIDVSPPSPIPYGSAATYSLHDDTTPPHADGATWTYQATGCNPAAPVLPMGDGVSVVIGEDRPGPFTVTAAYSYPPMSHTKGGSIATGVQTLPPNGATLPAGRNVAFPIGTTHTLVWPITSGGQPIGTEQDGVPLLHWVDLGQPPGSAPPRDMGLAAASWRGPKLAWGQAFPETVAFDAAKVGTYYWAFTAQPVVRGHDGCGNQVDWPCDGGKAYKVLKAASDQANVKGPF
jgi:hypothetical protein